MATWGLAAIVVENVDPAVAVRVAARPAGTYRFERMTLADRAKTVIEYAVVEPAGFDPSKIYPALLALPPGGQDRATTEAVLSRVWVDEARSRGWVVISPVAPHDVLFFNGSEVFIPPLLDRLQKRYRVEGGKWQLAGVSNGGVSAFRVAVLSPSRFASITVFPGFANNHDVQAKLGSLKSIPVTMFVGGDDRGWVTATQETAARLRAAGGTATVEVRPGEGHIMASLTGAQLFDVVVRARPPQR